MDMGRYAGLRNFLGYALAWAVAAAGIVILLRFVLAL